MENKDLIPFSIEKWETGEYEVLAEDNSKVVIQEIFDENIYFRELEGGRWVQKWCELNFNNLRLRKKPKKVWVPRFKGTFATKEECDYYFSELKDYDYAIEVEI